MYLLQDCLLLQIYKKFLAFQFREKIFLILHIFYSVYKLNLNNKINVDVTYFIVTEVFLTATFIILWFKSIRHCL